ncbi:MAG TPA: magnesium transporter [Acidobacteriota bacterium]|nr:magnesium transporter [Acidobacteriota bacterium]
MEQLEQTGTSQPVPIDEILAQVRTALENNDLDHAVEILCQYRPPDQAEVFEELSEEERRKLLPNLSPELTADILEELDSEEAAELIEALPVAKAARIVEEMEPDEAADVLAELAPSRAEALVSALEDPDEVRPLLLHPEESAGGLMTSEFVALRRRMTAQEAINTLRAWAPRTDTAYYLYVVDRNNKLCGVVSLRQLVVADPNTPIMEIMDPDVIAVQDDTDQEEVARIMSRYGFLAVPVVDKEGHLVGVITADDIFEVIEDEATEDIQRFGGAEPLDRGYLETSPLTITKKRVGWLLLLFLTATLTGTVIRLFQADIETVAALVVFIPLLIGTGGNAGSQTTATVIRALAVGEITTKDAFLVWWQEARVGVLLGLAMGTVAFIRAITWEPNPRLAATVALATVGVIVWATFVGAVLPILAARFKIDPAAVSGPVMSTLVDATGLIIYFMIARWILGLAG